MAEKEVAKQEVKQESAAKETAVPNKIQFVGTKAGGSYSPTYLHIPSAPSKEPVKFVQNEILEVGKDVTQTEAKQLLASKTYVFKEVK